MSDQAHVIIDALASHTAAIAAGATPWQDYDGDPADPKLTEHGYRQLMVDAEEAVSAVLAGPQGPPRFAPGDPVTYIGIADTRLHGTVVSAHVRPDDCTRVYRVKNRGAGTGSPWPEDRMARGWLVDDSDPFDVSAETDRIAGRMVTRYVVGYRNRRIIVGADTAEDARRLAADWLLMHGPDPADLDEYPTVHDRAR